jgi:hypothetical protein
VHPLLLGSAQTDELVYRDSPTALFDLVDTKVLQKRRRDPQLPVRPERLTRRESQ